MTDATQLYLLERTGFSLWLIPDSTGIPTVLRPQPQLFQAAYIESMSDQNMQVAQTQLGTKWRWLLSPIPCPDGAPYRSAVLFIFDRELKSLPWRDGTQTHVSATMSVFRPATKTFSLSWVKDVYGFFVTGPAKDSVWRLFRAELDALDRWILTLSPVRLSSHCPEADFSALSLPLLSQEVAAQYSDLAKALTSNSYREVVTKAKNIVEAIVASKLGNAVKSRDLYGNLKVIKKSVESTSDDWTPLEYHLLNKIRLVHGQTHATNTARAGRVLRPEFALSTVEDLVELLRLWGYCHD